uniref:Uncharacterized protein n=1 Tax=Romanomermis culicivorax TaxID=13658 RepID=A0A915IQU5_ROMCU
MEQSQSMTNENQRLVDRKAEYIENWKKKPGDGFFKLWSQWPFIAGNKNIIEQNYCHQLGSSRELAKEILAK